MLHAIAGPSAAGMLLSSLQGCIYSVTCNSMPHNYNLISKTNFSQIRRAPANLHGKTNAP